MRIIIQKNAENVGVWAAKYVADQINKKAQHTTEPFVLGLPTGSSPLNMYKHLVKLFEDGYVSFQNVITFNMDEYVGLLPENENSYSYFMHEHFFKFIDIKSENINLLDGMTADIRKECERYEEKIVSCGGIDLFVGGVGIDGHIAFNEPGSSLKSRTRDKELLEATRIANARFFDNDIDKVPKLALTVGIATITDAKSVLIISDGKQKARAIQHAIEGSINHLWTVSMLQTHEKALFCFDDLAAEELKIKTYRHFCEIERSEII